MVVEIKLLEDIEGELLQRALDKTLNRYFYLTQKFAEITGDFYLVANDKPLLLRNSGHFLPLGGTEVNEHLLDIHYLDKILFISYHHGLCDGRGIMPFIRTLLFYYLSAKHLKISKPESVRLSTSPLLEGELKEPGLVELTGVSRGLPFPDGEEYILPEVREVAQRPKISYLNQIEIEHDSFIRYTKSIGATPAIAMSLIFSKAIEANAKEKDKEIICNLVVDLRNGIDLTHTHRNCVSTIKLGFNSSKVMKELAGEYRNKILEFKPKDNLQLEIQKIIGLSNGLDKLSSYSEKQKVISFLDTLHSDTYSLSYIGQLDMGEYEQYIQEIHTYSSGTPGLSIEMFAVKKAFFLDIMQSFGNDCYVNSFIEELGKADISIKVTKHMQRFNTPNSVVMTNK